MFLLQVSTLQKQKISSEQDSIHCPLLDYSKHIIPVFEQKNLAT